MTSTLSNKVSAYYIFSGDNPHTLGVMYTYLGCILAAVRLLGRYNLYDTPFLASIGYIYSPPAAARQYARGSKYSIVNIMEIRPIGRGELWLAQSALFVAIILQVAAWALNPDLAYGPHNLIAVVEVALSVIIGLNASKRHLHRTSLYRTFSFVLLGIVSAANIMSFFLVAKLLILTDQVVSGRQLIIAALAIFLTNIIVFALWYWEIDSPGLSGHKWSHHDKDFQFTQQDMPHEFPDWQPGFIDYAYLSVTNAINFAPADTKPITTQAKCLMAVQALVSVFTLALILARSISILG